MAHNPADMINGGNIVGHSAPEPVKVAPAPVPEPVVVKEEPVVEPVVVEEKVTKHTYSVRSHK